MPVIQQHGSVKTVAGLPDRWGRRAYAELQKALKLGADSDAYKNLCALLDKITTGPIPVDATDAQLCILAENCASDCVGVPFAEEQESTAPRFMGETSRTVRGFVGPDLQQARAPAKPARDRMAEICRARGIEPPDLEDDQEAMARMSDQAWWRANLRRTHGRHLEHAAMRLGFVSRRKGSYCSDETVRRRQQQLARNAAALRGTMIRNTATGQEFSLYDLAQTGMANKSNRKGELMLRMAGCEDVAKELGHVGLFVTLTAPSKYHAVLAGTGEANPKYQGATPRETQAYLNEVWARIRAQNARDNVAPYGFRIVEPHHDGCPHWHMLVFVPASDVYGVEGMGPTREFYPVELEGPTREVRLVELQGPTLDGKPIRRRAPFMGGQLIGMAERTAGELWIKRGFVTNLTEYALAEDGDEPGAKRNRVKVVQIDPSKGTAAAYIMKYIGKNIDDSQGAAFDEDGAADLGGELQTPCERVDAWAAVWGIRQFQGLGMPPVTVWRELRRVKGEHEDAPDYIKRAILASRRIEAKPDADGVVEVIKPANFGEYIRAQGGVCIGRDYLVSVAWRGGYVPGRYGVVVRDVPAGVVGVESFGTLYPSTRYEWERAGRAAGVSGFTRSPLNNCTDQAEPGDWLADMGPVQPSWWVESFDQVEEFNDSEWLELIEAAGELLTPDELDRIWAPVDQVAAVESRTADYMPLILARQRLEAAGNDHAAGVLRGHLAGLHQERTALAA